MLVRDIAGCYQTQQQEQKLAPDADAFHIQKRAGCCIVVFLPLLEKPLIDSESLLAELPVSFIAPHADLLLQLQFRNPQPVFAEEALQFAQDRQFHEEPVHWYTDGSHFHPEDPLTRFPASSIILDIAKGDLERRSWGKHCAPVAQIPPTLIKAAVGKPVGNKISFVLNYQPFAMSCSDRHMAAFIQIAVQLSKGADDSRCNM